MAGQRASTARRPRRWKRRLAIGFAVVVVLLLTAAWQLPWLLGTAPGRAFIASILSTDSMRFSIDSLDLTWSGDQAIGGVRIRDAQGREVADVSAAFKGSLWAWAWARGSRDFGSVSLAGTVTVYESPSTGRPRPEPSPGGAPPPTTGGSGDRSGVVIPEGVKASLNLDALTVKYVPLPGSSQPPMAVRDVKGSLAVDGRSPVTLTLAGATEIGDSIGSFEIDASISDFAAADGSLQPDRATFTAAIAGERLPAPIIDRLAGQQGRLTALLGESIDLTLRASGGADGGEAAVNARSERATAELSATVDAQRRLTLTRGRAMLKANQQTLEALLSAEQLAGLSLAEEATAVLDVSRLAVQLPDSGGALDLSKTILDATLSIAAAAIETGREDLAAATVRDLAVRITSDDPTREIRLTAGAQVISRLAGESEPVAAPFDADLALVRAFKADGDWSGETLGLAGTVRIGDVPTSLVDALSGAEGWIVDALGPMIARVELTAGSDASADRSTLIGLSLSAPEAQASASLRLADGRIESMSGRAIEAAASIRPALRDRLASMLAESAPQVRLEEGGRVMLRVTSLSMMMPGESQPQPWKAAAIEGSLILQNARGTYAPAAGEDSAAAPKRYDVESLAAEFRTAAAGESLAAQVRAAVRQDDVPLSMSGRAEVLSAFDAEKRQVTIEMDETTAPPAIITAWAPGREEVIGEVLGGPVRLALNAMHYAGGLSANASMRGERSEAQLTYAMQAGRTLFELRGSQRATPALVAALLGPDPAVVLVEPADVAYTLTMPAQSAPGASFGAWPLKLDASTPRAVIATPRRDGGSSDATPRRGAPPAQSATLTAVDFTLRSDWPQGLDGAGRYAFTGAVTDGVAAIASLSGDASYTIGGDWKQSRGRVEAKGIDVAALERTLNVGPGTLSAWLGARGGLEVGSVVDAQGQLTDDLLVAAQFDRASGRLAGRLAEDRLIVNTPGTISANLERGRLGQLLNGWTGGAAEPTPWAALEDANLSATIRSVSLPLAALSGESYDPALLSIDADVTVPRLALRHGATDLSLADAALKIGGASLAEGLTAQLKAATQTGAAAPAGGIDLNALVRSATSNAEDRRYTVRGSMRGVPVAIVDAIARMEGKLVAAVGPTMDMQLNLAEAHRNGGSLTASIVTPNGTLNVPKADLRDNTLVIESANPVAASLEVTPEMSASLLSNVNPLLYDVRKKAGPIAFNAPRLVVPLDGDVSKLGGEFTLDLGQLYVPTKGILGEFLGQLKPRTDQTEPDRVETTIPPITGRINKGVLEYDKFIMQSQAFEITTSGKVDLVKRRLDLLAAVPLIGWKSVFADMTKIAPAFLTDIPVNVPFYLVVRGPIDKPEIKPDPKGAQRVADEFFRNIGGNLIDNVFDNIFKPRR